jgi:hypothetical protein
MTTEANDDDEEVTQRRKRVKKIKQQNSSDEDGLDKYNQETQTIKKKKANHHISLDDSGD